jgi:uracil phosphoribosyltransferase
MKQDPRFPNLFITDHPLIQHKLSHMRDKSTSTRTFRGTAERNHAADGLRNHP